MTNKLQIDILCCFRDNHGETYHIAFLIESVISKFLLYVSIYRSFIKRFMSDTFNFKSVVRLLPGNVN